MRWIAVFLCVFGAALWGVGVLLPCEVHYRSDPKDMKFPTDLGYTGKPTEPRFFDKEVSLGKKWPLVGLATLILGALAPILVLAKKQSLLATAAMIPGVIHGFGFVGVIMSSNGSTPSTYSVEIVWLTCFALLLGYVAIFGAVALRNRQSTAKS